MSKPQPIVDPQKYYESIIFKEENSAKTKASDFINELIDMALKFHLGKGNDHTLKEAN